MLVLAAQSAGVSARDPYWFMAWTNLFAAALTLLEYSETRVPTLKGLLDAVLLPDPDGALVPDASRGKAGGLRQERMIEVLARTALDASSPLIANGLRLKRSRAQVIADLTAARTQIQSFFDSDHVRTIEAFIVNAFSTFQQHRFECLSATRDASARNTASPSGRPASTTRFSSRERWSWSAWVQRIQGSERRCARSSSACFSRAS